MIVAELTGAAQRYARWDEPDEATAAAVAELCEIADGHADLLAEVAGIQLGTKEGSPTSPGRGTLPSSAASPEPTRP